MKKLLVVIALITSALCVNAQGKWNGEIGLGFTYNEGNVTNMNLKNTGKIERNDSLISFDANYKFLYSKEDSVETNRGLTGGIKFDFLQYGKWSPFFAAEVICNKYKGYDFKTSILLGVKYRIYTNPGKCDYSISAAGVCDYVDYTVEEDNPLPTNVWRMSIRPKIKQKFGEAVALTHYTFYQPNLEDFDDYIVNSHTALETKLSEHFFFETSFDYEYRSYLPTEDYKRRDVTTEVTLKIKW